jgi:hypothetical protein
MDAEDEESKEKQQNQQLKPPRKASKRSEQRQRRTKVWVEAQGWKHRRKERGKGDEELRALAGKAERRVEECNMQEGGHRHIIGVCNGEAAGWDNHGIGESCGAAGCEFSAQDLAKGIGIRNDEFHEINWRELRSGGWASPTHSWPTRMGVCNSIIAKRG